MVAASGRWTGGSRRIKAVRRRLPLRCCVPAVSASGAKSELIVWQREAPGDLRERCLTGCRRVYFSAYQFGAMRGMVPRG
jgi:hypothetical protein